MIIEFRRDLDHLEVPRRQFGIFRNDEQPRSVQWIEERWREVRLPNGRLMGFLELKYEVPYEYNGWWLKLGDADWARYKEGFLILRLSPGPGCTPVFKLELKAGDPQRTHPVYVALEQSHRALAAEKGFADVVIPLTDFGIGDFSRMRELVIVFEKRSIDPAYRKGTLLVRSMRLSLDKDPQAQTIDALLDDLGHRVFRWFAENHHPKTGLVRDRAPNCRGSKELPAMASIASSGYFLSMLPEAVRRGELSESEAAAKAEVALRFALGEMEHHEGLFYHFVHLETGKRWEQSEVSLLDSAIFFNGCMVAGQRFGGKVQELADALLDRADWPKFLIRHPKDGKPLLALGWTPEKGMLGPADVRSSEMAMPYFLAVGSRTHPIDPACWFNTSVGYRRIGGYKVLHGDLPLFTSYYGLGWHDLRGCADRDGADLFGNARQAALANRAFCRELGLKFRTYTAAEGGWWGISAGDSPAGYVACGPVHGDPDGTVWPLAALATLPWIPDEMKEDVARWRASEPWESALGDFGVAPFNLDRKWVGQDLIGIDVGSFYLSLANHANRTVWDLWMQHPIAISAIRKLDLKPAKPSAETGR